MTSWPGRDRLPARRRRSWLLLRCHWAWMVSIAGLRQRWVFFLVPLSCSSRWGRLVMMQKRIDHGSLEE